MRVVIALVLILGFVATAYADGKVKKVPLSRAGGSASAQYIVFKK